MSTPAAYPDPVQSENILTIFLTLTVEAPAVLSVVSRPNGFQRIG